MERARGQVGLVNKCYALKVSVRPGNPGDADRLAVLGAQVWMHTYATQGVTQVIAEYVVREFSTTALAAILASSSFKHVAVAEIGASIVGYAVLAFSTPCPSDPKVQVELVTLHVQEHFSRQGVGSALLHYAQRLAQERASRLWLMVNAKNVPAIAFYEKRGYTKVGTAYFELGGKKHENHVLTSRGA